LNYLLDTCAVSEFTKPVPDAGLLTWLDATPESHLYLSAVTLGELQQGISRLPVSARRQRLQAWLDDDLQPRFADRILIADAGTCLLWGQLRAKASSDGIALPVLDGLIAATALLHQLVLVTRNERDFQHVAALGVVNPWSGCPAEG
jgi:predicted nucleic acid-binding protein